MVVDDLNVMGVVALPAEANPKLVVDADAVLAETITGQLFESIGGRHLQIGEGRGRIEHNKLTKSNALEIGWKFANLVALREARPYRAKNRQATLLALLRGDQRRVRKVR